MAEPFLAEVRICSFNFAPQGWAFCNGQLLPINQNQALFSLLGTTFGGDGQTNFALPDLRGRFPMHFGNGHFLGERGGETAHTLTAQEMPVHTHAVTASGATGTLADPAGALWAASSTRDNLYVASPNTVMSSSAVAMAGGSQSHENMPPYHALNFVIALVGIFPSRN